MLWTILYFILPFFSRLCQSTNTPLIGILSLPCYVEPHNCPEEFVENGVSYIPASYVKWLEGGGARVVPIQADMDQKDVQLLLSTLNGVLFTGGSAYFNNDPGNFYWPQVHNILSYLREFHHSNPQVSIPLWGTCLGFEAIICATAKAGTNVAGTFDAENLAVPINFSSNASESRIFDNAMDSSYSKAVYDVFANEAVSMNNHQSGFSPRHFQSDEYLATNFTLLGTSNDANNLTFVTLMESIDDLQLFWYGSQFHPEKPQYEFDASDATNTPHFYDAIFANQYLSEFFVNECRLRNNNVMTEDDYLNSVIYNYNAYYLAKAESDVSYEQVYIFTAAQ